MCGPNYRLITKINLTCSGIYPSLAARLGVNTKKKLDQSVEDGSGIQSKSGFFFFFLEITETKKSIPIIRLL